DYYCSSYADTYTFVF
nr:immunoglobulin light chain junction region [Macaca mulatta]MOV72484.1 immunoglobulin light chain junction region [Macaca mulatta]MOV72537.1 immunoglobulin light chain junction region [Macaca mulatta]MOV72768.1 immunoglobulin light chain junction region [Macaca mulatta]MOV72800.1 immunoglobulin light chain junction region [Macaca mulatta]